MSDVQQPTATAAAAPWMPSAEAANPEERLTAMKADTATVAILMNARHPAHAHVTAQWNQAHLDAYGTAEDKARGLADPSATVASVVGPRPSAEEAPADKPPASADAYDLAVPAHKLMPGLEPAAPEMIEEAQSIFLAAGLSQDDAVFVRECWTATQIAEMRGMPAATAEGTRNELAQRHGGEEAADKMIADANAYLKQALTPEQHAQAKAWLQTSGFGNSRLLIERIADLAARRGKR